MGTFLYYCVSYMCYTAEQRLTAAVLRALVMAHPRCTQLVKQELLQERVTKGKIDIWSLEVRD